MNGDNERAIEIQQRALMLVPPTDTMSQRSLEEHLAKFKEAAKLAS